MSDSKQEIKFLLNKLVTRKKIAEKEREKNIKNSLDRIDTMDKHRKSLTGGKQTFKDDGKGLKNQKYSDRFSD